jgi:hypothetical protein
MFSKWFYNKKEPETLPSLRDPVPHKTAQTERESRRAEETRGKLRNLIPSPNLNPVIVVVSEHIRNNHHV